MLHRITLQRLREIGVKVFVHTGADSNKEEEERWENGMSQMLEGERRPLKNVCLLLKLSMCT